MERRLVAILAADVAGYTALMGADEAGTHARLKTLRTEVIEPVVAGRGGRIVKLTGDGLLVEFQSVVAALECALAWQAAVAEHEAGEAAERRLCFRIGINVGDVIIEEGDIYGDGVNVAARLEALAEPGGICISADAWRQARGRVAAEAEDMGPQALKHVAEPVQVFRIRPPGTSGAPADLAAAIATRPAVAVLPFDNMSGDPEQAYFSDGLAEDIITALSHWRSFPVIARNSSFTYKGRAVNVREVGRELGARYVLEGSVRRAGERLRVTAQLIDAETGHHVWAERFDRRLDDVFEVQDEITNRIAATIVPELEHVEQRRSALRRTGDLGAWDFYLRGLETFYDETCASNAKSLEMFRRASELDPGYGDAWAMLGWCHSRAVMFGCVQDPGESLEQGFAAARRAVALDPGSALAHLALGTVHIWAGETELGLEQALVAHDLNPNFAIAGMAAGNRLDLVGRTEEGIALMEQALALNPRDPNRWRYMAYMSRALISRGEYAKAAEWARRSVALRPDHHEALFRCAVALAHVDAVEEARALIERCRQIAPDYLAGRRDWRPYPDAARNEHLLGALERHGLLD